MREHLKKVAEHHDAWAGAYDEDYFEHYALYHAITLDNVRRFLPAEKDLPVLDAGGGTGIWSVELARLGYRVTLIDISEGMLEKAAENVARAGFAGRVEIRKGDILDLGEFEDGGFAMALAEGDPLSYCGGHEKATAELARVVTAGGAVIASVDNRAAALNWLRESGDLSAVEAALATGEFVMPNRLGTPPYTVHAFTPEELARLFEANGLSVERVLGKPVIAHRFPWLRGGPGEVDERVLALELKYCDDPAFITWGGHLEIAGRKL